MRSVLLHNALTEDDFSMRITFVIGSPILGFVHLLAGAVLSTWLFTLMGGVEISGQLTRYGGIDFAWTNISWIPAGLVLAVPEDVRGPTGTLGLSLFGAGSMLAGLGGIYLLFVRHESGSLYTHRLFQVLSALLWLGWLPVPVRMSLTYWHTVAF